MRITAKDFQEMLHVNDKCLLSHLVLVSVTPEVIKTYEDKKALDIVLTINGIEVDVMQFLKIFEDQYDEQVAISARKIYGKQAREALAPFSKATDTLLYLFEHIEGEVKEAVAKATNSEWLLRDEEEELDDGN